AGAEHNGLSRSRATQLFDLIEKFAGYGFNKSHAAAYALIAYQTAWFKAHHPAAFMAANLSLVMDDTDKVRALYADTQDQGIAILPPDINSSAYRFEPIDGTRIRYGLGGIKGTGAHAVEALVAARDADGPFASLADFCRRVDKRAVNRRAVEALIKGGAFDSVEPRRVALLAAVGVTLAEAERAQAQAAQNSLFGGDGADTMPPLPDIADWTEPERLAHEKSALGFYVSGHPYNAHAAELAGLVRTRLADIEPRAERYLIAGIVTAVRTQVSRRGKMAFVTLDDGKSSVEIVVFNEMFEAARNRLRDDCLVIAEVKVMQRVSDDGDVQGLRVIVESVFDLTEARRRFARRLALACNGNASGDKLERILAPYRDGATPITVHYENNGVSGEFELPAPWRVNLDNALIDRLQEWLSPSNVTIVY
ncbi:MAG: OB-fold nucleic acid binding domain-containing protein, partial [Casimicrobiaceae bacterium]